MRLHLVCQPACLHTSQLCSPEIAGHRRYRNVPQPSPHQRPPRIRLLAGSHKYATLTISTRQYAPLLAAPPLLVCPWCQMYIRYKLDPQILPARMLPAQPWQPPLPNPRHVRPSCWPLPAGVAAEQHDPAYVQIERSPHPAAAYTPQHGLAQSRKRR